ncbi:cellulase N-terminal Ig-like domain-containing protein [Dyadobacter subterraneus]|uniref:cellulase N-terminal Ig-like domain-containing protein n=1 Tax=Dyadobacter subterraneus TaxID=2773304 RepID=UPI001D16C3FF|nr:cellulase N-terminal Ig-like domain-containing protein [Dyadobacter subterraneus]
MASSFKTDDPATSWIRINQLGYLPAGSKVAVWATKAETLPTVFQLRDSETSKVVFSGKVGKSYGKYGPFNQLLRLNFSTVKTPGSFYLKCGNAVSPVFKIGHDVYAGAADFGLR